MRLADPPASVADTLRATRALIETPERWTQGAYARDAAEQSVSEDDPAAQKWCMLGALDAVDGLFQKDAYHLLRQVIGQGINRFNDSHEHHEVLAAFDRAIALAEQQP